jgi:uncharacterized protein
LLRSTGKKMKILILAVALFSAAGVVQAQTAASNAASAVATTSGTAKPSAAKKALIDKILKLQQPSIELLARSIAEGPAMQMVQQADMILRRLPPEQRETLSKGMQADLQKYLAETVPLAQERSVVLAPSSIGKVLDDKFTEVELRQVIALLESPIHRKFSEQSFAMQRALQEKLVADIRSTVEPQLKNLDQSWIKRFQDAAPAATDKTVPPAPAAPGPTSK